MFALICTMGFSQVSFNVKAGLNLSSYIGENSDHSEFKPGARIGVGMEYQFNDMISLQPSLFFSQKGAKYSSGFDGNIIDADADVKINQLYLELPVNVQFRFNIADNTNLVIATGPYLACGVGGKAKFDGDASVGGIHINGDDKIDTFGDDGLDSLKTLKTEIRHIIKDKKATIGVALILDGEDTLAINNAEKYPMMSVYKFHQALAVCDYLQKRHIPLSTSLYLDKKYFKPDTYSPLRDKYPQGNLELPISELLVYTMQSSDNVACDILFDYIGGVNVVDEYIHSLGINDVSITATEDEMHQDMDDCYKNWTTPMEAANLLELFMTQDFMRNEYTDFLKHIMIECGTGKDRLPAPLPESEVKIGHKTGTSDKNDRGEYIGINDIGFVILPDGSRYVVAVFVKDSKENMETNAKIISDISAAVYRYAGNR